MSNSTKLIIDNRCGGIVKQVRLELKCSQSELGKKLGVSQGVISQVECKRKLPNESFLEKLARISGCSLKQLTGQEPICYAAIY